MECIRFDDCMFSKVCVLCFVGYLRGNWDVNLNSCEVLVVVIMSMVVKWLW